MEIRIPEGLLNELKQGLELIYGDQLQGVYLFGSYARGEQDSESDLDILIILDDFERYSTEVKRTGELVSNLSLKHGVSISRTFIRGNEWVTGDSPLLRNAGEEAVPA